MTDELRAVALAMALSLSGRPSCAQFITLRWFGVELDELANTRNSSTRETIVNDRLSELAWQTNLSDQPASFSANRGRLT